MSLVRPDQQLRVEGSPELSLEQKILGELGDIKDSQAFMRVVLLGGVYREVPHDGKLPLLDATIKLQQQHIDLAAQRIKTLEDDKLERDSALRTTKWLCGLLATGGSALGTVIVNWIMKH